MLWPTPTKIPLAIGFTGTQVGMTVPQQHTVTHLLFGVEWLHHGDCIGSDAEAHAIVRSLGKLIALHPPSNPSKRAFCLADKVYPPQDYIARNHAIVDATYGLLATPKERNWRPHSGTWATINYARKLGRPIKIVLPDGNIV